MVTRTGIRTAFCAHRTTEALVHLAQNKQILWICGARSASKSQANKKPAMKAGFLFADDCIWKTEFMTRREIENERIKGQIEILKISEDDNLINGDKKGTPIENVEFEIRKEDGGFVERIVTDKEGIAISSNLEKGSYIIRETKGHKDYKISNEEFKIQIEHHKKIKEITITNISKEPEKPKLPRTGF